MATKSAKMAMTSVHTAGIYADMTVDGPDIGTLVVIVDRAKNLPNRKTMGKQDPYCAARLGKEAKKTETDKRGGQTPRWDQELRFTVHDSPDYHQLKVSVFNDDKRTDLIGETWVSLEKVVVPGGGQNDLWHSLNCKGRYAGDIRIELTYYDTRPKEERARPTPDIPTTTDSQEREVEALKGLGQSKAVQRRPLPADPTLPDSSPLRPVMPDHAQSSPLPYTPAKYHNGSGVYKSPHSTYSSALPSGTMYQEHVQISSQVSPSFPYTQEDNAALYGKAPITDQPSDGLYVPSHNRRPSSASDEALSHNTYTSSRNVLSRPPVPYPTQEEGNQLYLPQIPQQHPDLDLDLPQLPPYTPNIVRPIAQKPHTYPTQQNGSISSPISGPSHHRFSEEVYPQSQSPIQSEEKRHQDGRQRHHKGYQQSPLRYHSHDDHYSTVSSPMQPTQDDEGLPPPPPVHRSSGFNSPNGNDQQIQRQDLGQVAAPAPLNARHGRGGFVANPSAKNYADLLRDNQTNLISSSGTQPRTPSAYQTPTYDMYSSQRRRQSYDPNIVSLYDPCDQSTPPSLIPGYDPHVAEVASHRVRQGGKLQPVQQHIQSGEISELGLKHDYYTDNHNRPNTVDPSRRNENVRDGQAHTPFTSTMHVRAISPDPRAPMRKSLSPQPQSTPREGILTSVPFSPDSYEVLNPNLKCASNINQAGPTYKTPEQAKDAYRQKEQEENLENGPIIGSDGRVIDPSDHLPTATWAPEPEQKPPRKGPEITFRFRQSPLGAQPMPDSVPRPPRQTVIRPHSIATTTHSYSVDSISPTTAGRNRLQKKTRMSPTHANSSPILPVSDNIPSSTYSLREHVNYGLSSSPGYLTNSPNAPPPVPAKILMPAGQEDWVTDALSEEMKRIDIGVGVGTARTKKSRYRP